MAIARSACGAGGRFRRCHSAAVNSCQYCGRSFCASHTHVIEGYDAVCTRKRCVRKHVDLQAHTDYRARVVQRNAAGLCGVEGCGPHPRKECSLCKGHFCEAHIGERMYPFREGRLIIDKPASVCRWCWRRRKVWRR
jgi:hypothetical protein